MPPPPHQFPVNGLEGGGRIRIERVFPGIGAKEKLLSVGVEEGCNARIRDKKEEQQ